MHDGRGFVEHAAGVSDTHSARSQEGADAGDADLASVRMTGQHQINMMCFRPAKLIGAMGQ